MSDATTKTDPNVLAVDRRNLPFELDRGFGSRARIGIIVLASDLVIEAEFANLTRNLGVALYQSRVYNANDVNPETLAAMEAGLAGAASLILPEIPLDVVAYGCTSGALTIGNETVAARIHEAKPGVKTTTPLAAALAGLQALGSQSIALLTPYLPEINETLRGHIQSSGLAVPVMGSFNEPDDTKVGRITLDSLRGAVLALGQRPEVDTVFVSCTNLRLAEIIPELEETLDKPVLSSNFALAWHCLRLAGIDDALPHLGRLYGRGLGFS